MGLSTINVEFKAAAQTAVKRSANGTVALILKDETKEDTTYVYSNETEVVKSHWTSDNLNYINMAFKGSPKKVIIERIAAEGSLDDALKRLANKKWNYLAIPSLQDSEVKTVADWIIAQRTAKKPFKAVLPHSVSNNIGIINFDTDDIKIGTKTYKTAEFCVYIASIIAGTALNESVTGKVISEINSITESLTPDADVDAGKLILINDGEQVEIARGVNSLTTVGTNQTEDMKSIKIVEGMDLIAEDIRTTFKENYIGRSNSIENKELFIAAVNQYFETLTKEGVLYDGYDHYAEIDIEAQREYLASKSVDVTDMSDVAIKQANTGTFMFMAAHIQMQNAAEDLKFVVNM